MPILWIITVIGLAFLNDKANKAHEDGDEDSRSFLRILMAILAIGAIVLSIFMTGGNDSYFG